MKMDLSFSELLMEKTLQGEEFEGERTQEVEFEDSDFGYVDSEMPL